MIVSKISDSCDTMLGVTIGIIFQLGVLATSSISIPGFNLGDLLLLSLGLLMGRVTIGTLFLVIL